MLEEQRGTHVIVPELRREAADAPPHLSFRRRRGRKYCPATGLERDACSARFGEKAEGRREVMDAETETCVGRERIRARVLLVCCAEAKADFRGVRATLRSNRFQEATTPGHAPLTRAQQSAVKRIKQAEGGVRCALDAVVEARRGTGDEEDQDAGGALLRGGGRYRGWQVRPPDARRKAASQT